MLLPVSAVPAGAQTGEALLAGFASPALQADRSALFLSGPALGDPYLPQALSCSINVRCREGRRWPDAITATVRIVREGGVACTGVLLNNTREDQTPYVLTAHHCGQPSVGQVVDWVFEFNYQSATCEDPSLVPVPQSVSGATVVAAQGGYNDFVLLELARPIPPSFAVTYAGWSIADKAPSSAVLIGHPRQDIKKITVDDDPLTDAGAFWIATFDHGTVEQGSSGAPLFNRKEQVIGLVRSAISVDDNACSGPGSDDNAAVILFPKLSENWFFGRPGERLVDFLDPWGDAVQVRPLRPRPSWTNQANHNSASPSINALPDEAPGTATHTWAAYPNPFNPRTRITLSVTRRQHVAVAAYDVTGRRVAVMFEGALEVGSPRTFTFEAAALPSGVYLIRAAGETFVDTQTVTLFK